jgi:predicted MFS family arabinose efflux permease
VPEAYRARALTVIFATFSLGTVAGLLLTPLLAACWGWPSAFSFFAALGLAWGLVRPSHPKAYFLNPKRCLTLVCKS